MKDYISIKFKMFQAFQSKLDGLILQPSSYVEIDEGYVIKHITVPVQIPKEDGEML